jgi:hypothetical protein
MNFIELTQNGKKFSGNINLLQRVIDNGSGAKTTVIGWNNNGGFEVDENYQTVVGLINATEVAKAKQTEASFRGCVHPYNEVVQDHNGTRCNQCGTQLTD